MDWLVYWFMFPACIIIAGVATFSGISGAALMTPLFILGFPLLGIPILTTIAAIGAALVLETSGFGTGVYHYYRMGLADYRTVKKLLLITVPLAIVGAALAHFAPATLLRIIYGVAMLAVAWMLLKRNKTQSKQQLKSACPCLVCQSDCSDPDCAEADRRKIKTHNGKVYEWCMQHQGSQQIISGIGAFLAGLISTGVGEATLPTLVRRSRFPVPVAAATSTMVVAGTVLAASLVHLVLLVLKGGLDAIPWNLIVWGIPGAIIGASIGTRLQGKFSERSTRIFFGILFLTIGIVFLFAFI